MIPFNPRPAPLDRELSDKALRDVESVGNPFLIRVTAFLDCGKVYAFPNLRAALRTVLANLRAKHSIKVVHISQEVSHLKECVRAQEKFLTPLTPGQLISDLPDVPPGAVVILNDNFGYPNCIGSAKLKRCKTIHIATGSFGAMLGNRLIGAHADYTIFDLRESIPYSPCVIVSTEARMFRPNNFNIDTSATHKSLARIFGFGLTLWQQQRNAKEILSLCKKRGIAEVKYHWNSLPSYSHVVVENVAGAAASLRDANVEIRKLNDSSLLAIPSYGTLNPSEFATILRALS